jgi:3-dehydroquinate dehydratase-2
MTFHIINGPNLNLLGKREPEIYGNSTFEDYFVTLQRDFKMCELHYFQSNYEGAIIDHLHNIGFSSDGIVFNPGAYTHTSVALADAIAAISSLVIEVHISNTFARESFRHHSYVSPVAKGIIVGLGLDGYRLALQYLYTKHYC